MTQFKSLKPGTALSEAQFYTVEKIVGDKVQLQTETGGHVVVDKPYVENYLTSADQYSETKTISRTEAAAILLANPGVVMTVCFNKQVKETDVIKEIMTAYEGATPKAMETAVKKAVKKALTGEERVMVGRHFGELNDLGRINFIDMEVPKEAGKAYDTRIRQMDPRTINWMICRGTKYVVK